VRAIVLSLLLLSVPAAAENRIEIQSGNDPVVVGGKRYHLVDRNTSLVALVERDDPRKPRRLVIDVVRLGPKTRKLRGRTPLVARIKGARRRVLPTRPRLVPSRRVSTHDWIASFPVRYRVRLPKRTSTKLRLGLLKPQSGGQVGVLVRYESGADQLAPLDGPIAAQPRVIKGRTRVYGAKKKPKPKPDPLTPKLAGLLKNPPPMPSEDAGPPVPEPLVVTDAGPPPEEPLDAGPAPPPPEPVPEPAKIVVAIDDQLSGPFRLIEHRVEINDQVVAERVIDEPDLELPRQVDAFTGELEPGRHTVRVSLTWEGEGGFLFTYLREYAFIVEDEANLEVAPGESIVVRATGYNEGGFFTDTLEQPAVRLDIERR
jgi:hypothetical protein